MRKALWVVFVILLLVLSKSYLGKAYKIPAASMEPTLLIGDRFFVDMDYYKDNDPQRGDIAVFIFPKDNKSHFVKRIIGLPGEKLQIIDDRLYINEEQIIEHYAIYDGSAPGHNRDHGPEDIPADTVFVLGDNRNNSYDSRFWGPVPIADLLGKANRIYWSKDKGRIWNKIQ